ncbi:MAG: O-antigen ligase family protein [Deltaproteobacteria bacterium]|nr:O-antigen ligase family protein [Deltaproteobacteria bacterium]
MRSGSIASVREINHAVTETSWGRWIALATSGILLVFAPLAYGAVHPWAYCAMGLAAGIMSICLLSSGLLALVFKSEAKGFIPRPPLWWLAGGLGLLIFLQVAPWPAALAKWLSPAAWQIRALGNGYGLAPFIPLSLNPYKSVLEGLKLWPAVTLFFMLIYTLSTRRQIRLMAGIILGVALFETFYAFAHFRSHLIWGWQNLYTGTRLCGTLVNSDHLATLLTMSILLGFGLFLSARPAPVQGAPAAGVWGNLRRRSRAEQVEPLFRRFLLLFLLLLMAVGLIFTGSRSGIISLLAGFAVMGALIWSRHWKRVNIWLIIIFLIVAVIYSLILGSAQPLARFQNLGDSGRYYAFSGALKIFRGFPLLGSGIGTFGDVFYQFEPASLDGSYFLQAHSDWLQLLAESGAVGFSLVLIAFLTFYFRLMQQWQKRDDRFAQGLGLGGLAAMGAGSFQALAEFPFHIPAISLIFAAIAALTYAALYSQKQGWEYFSYPVIGVSGRRRLISGGLAGLIILQLLIILALGRVWLAEAAAPSEYDSTRPPQQLTRQDFQRALDYNSYNSLYYLGLADSLGKDKESAGKSLAVLKSAIFYAPANWGYRLRLAESCLQIYPKEPGTHLPMALKELAASVQLFPDSALLQYRLGSVLVWAERYYPGLVPPELRGQGNLHLAKAGQLNPKLKK